ncbi:MAG: membrane-associated Zn-dependent protease [Phycisphaerae bacterium]|nr:site-2 protease family protein [Phycisphaerae bacterium]NIP53436.1 site-2 protease family protein [Phycisphaerae bacterium]NIS52686.1 site-2 protease family protein [Phycisphaerae bacterium]NIU09928.1 site-2 protease family protein [Phycisphaerae bacterium]NIU57666.1 membrane-associated Zn-dependent protease [Phycisphaerae bacterium]
MNYLLVFILINALILAHELGHLIAAKLSGIPIEQFSIGFGRKLWSFKKGGTEYRISLFPVAGYVLPKVKDLDDFYRIPSSRRIIFALGGPFANIILALISLAVLNIVTTGFSFYTVFIYPFVQVVNITAQFLYALPSLFTSPQNLSGVVGIVAVGGRFVSAGLSSILQFAVLININLALLNLLPLPPLDGGKILFCLLEKIHHSLTRLRLPVMVTGWVLILSLICYITVLDVCRHVLKIYA